MESLALQTRDARDGVGDHIMQNLVSLWIGKDIPNVRNFVRKVEIVFLMRFRQIINQATDT